MDVDAYGMEFIAGRRMLNEMDERLIVYRAYLLLRVCALEFLYLFLDWRRGTAPFRGFKKVPHRL